MKYTGLDVFIASTILINIGLFLAWILSYQGNYRLSCISTDGTQKLQLDVSVYRRTQYNHWVYFRANDSKAVKEHWDGYCDAYRLE